jgi:hypothetical protein
MLAIECDILGEQHTFVIDIQLDCQSAPGGESAAQQSG